jgi:nucleoside-diphosphate kinase
MPERTLILVKPDGVRRGLVGEIISRFEAKGLRIAGMKMLRFNEELAARHYAEHAKKDFYLPLVKFITSGPVVALALEGEDVVEITRSMMGVTSHLESAPGTIRGDLAYSTRENLAHGSDSNERAQIELALFFNKDELFD